MCLIKTTLDYRLPLVIEALIKRSYRFPRLSLAVIFSKLIPRKLKLSRQFVR